MSNNTDNNVNDTASNDTNAALEAVQKKQLELSATAKAAATNTTVAATAAVTLLAAVGVDWMTDL